MCETRTPDLEYSSTGAQAPRECSSTQTRDIVERSNLSIHTLHLCIMLGGSTRDIALVRAVFRCACAQSRHVFSRISAISRLYLSESRDYSREKRRESLLSPRGVNERDTV